MALSVTEAQTVQSTYFDKVALTQQVYEEDPFLNKLKRSNKVMWDGGNDIQWGIRYRKYSRADAVDPDNAIAFQTKSTRTGAKLDWGYYSIDMMMTWEERAKNTGKSQIFNLIADKNTECLEDFMDRMATDLYTTNPNGLGYISLDVIVDSAAAYGGITVGNAASWAGIEDSSTTVLSLYGANSLSYSRNQATLGKKMPEMHVTTRDLAAAFESLIEPQKRYQDVETAAAGFANVTFHKAPVMGNPFVPSGYWYGLCPDVFELRYHPDWNFTKSPWTELWPTFPRNLGMIMSWMGNLVCRMRRVNFKYSALDYTLT